MYLHIGNNKNIREKTIIGIFDIESSTISNVTRKYLSAAEKKGEVESSTEELPKSFVLYMQDKKQRICFSQLSTSALLGRSGNLEN
ncbi:MAG: DUF370 domain-containing protein [Ruminococcaceae bacterium]|nr:DUF370 domain-containing protein [Oscillospiraceae bacterium]